MKLTQEQKKFLDSIYEKNFISVDNIHEEPYKSTAVDNHITLNKKCKLANMNSKQQQNQVIISSL